MGAAEGGVVDDALGAGAVGCDSGEGVNGDCCFAAGLGDPFDVEDDAACGCPKPGRAWSRGVPVLVDESVAAA